MKTFMRVVLGSILLLTLGGCLDTKVSSYVDPAYSDFRFQAVVISVRNGPMGFDEQLAKRIASDLRVDGIRARTAIRLFPPTRHYSPTKAQHILQTHGFDGMLVVALTGGSASSQVIGTEQFGAVNFYGSSASVSSTSVPIRGFSRFTSVRMALYDVKTRREAWIGTAETTARGALFMGDRATIDSLGDKITKRLMVDGLVKHS